jgi:hypothetical protein
VASRRKAAQADPAEIRAPFHGEGERKAVRAWRLAGAVATVLVFPAVCFVVGTLLVKGADVRPAGIAALCTFAVAGMTLLLGSASAESARARSRLAAARALLDAGCHDAAIIELKALHKDRESADEADWLVAQSYDRQGARRLALESYRAYLANHWKGAWVVEAKVRAEELEGGDKAAAAVNLLKAHEAQPDATCPFCKAATADDPTVSCDSCGTAHHAGCWEEQGGCSVYGCASRDARAVGQRVRE